MKPNRWTHKDFTAEDKAYLLNLTESLIMSKHAIRKVMSHLLRMRNEPAGLFDKIYQMDRNWQLAPDNPKWPGVVELNVQK